MEIGSILDEARAIAGQGASIPALRCMLLLFVLLGAAAWRHRRPGLSLLFLTLGSTLGLSYWLIQTVSPLGLGTDPRLTRDWAQAGVNAFAEPREGGFVWGTEAERSLVSTLAALRLPLPFVHHFPQIAAFLGLFLLVALPAVLIKNKTTGALTAALAIGGGLWPGVSPYDALLLRPSLLLVLGAGSAVVLVLARQRRVRRWFGDHALFLLVPFALAAADRSAIALMVVSILLTPPLRSALRRISPSPDRARIAEAWLLFFVAGGSGLFWWTPPRTLPGFSEATRGNEALQKPLDWLSLNVPPGDLILTSPTYSAAVAAFSGRRVLVPPPDGGEGSIELREPFRRARLRDSTLQGAPIARLADAFSLGYLLLGPGEPSPPVRADEESPDEPRLKLTLVYSDLEDFRVFRLVKK